MKKFLVSIFTLIFIISMITVVNAASGSINATPSSNQVTRGNTFTVTVYATSDDEMTGFVSDLSYDKSRLIKQENSMDTSGEGKIEIPVNTTGMKSGNIYTMTFKVADNAELGDTTINITNGTITTVKDGNEGSVTSLSTSATVNIVADETTIDSGIETPTEEKTETPTEEKTEDTKKITKTPTSKKSSTGSKSTSSKSSSKKTLPQTGVEVVSIVGIAVLSIVSIISYVSYRKYKNI